MKKGVKNCVSVDLKESDKENACAIVKTNSEEAISPSAIKKIKLQNHVIDKIQITTCGYLEKFQTTTKKITWQLTADGSNQKFVLSDVAEDTKPGCYSVCGTVTESSSCTIKVEKLTRE